MTSELPSIGRNEPCPCGSGKKYKRCCGVGAAPKITPPKIDPEASSPQLDALNSMDPDLKSQMVKSIQKLPKGQMQKLQAIMQRAMSGKDVTAEAEAFEKTLPADFQNMIRSFAQTSNLYPPPDVAPEASNTPQMPEMSEEEARALVAQAAAEGKISQDQAQTLLKTESEPAPDSDSSSPSHPKKGKFWQNFTGKKT